MLILGEIRTCLLNNSGPLPRVAVIELLGLKPGQQVLIASRPISRSVSPDLVVGVDCKLATEPSTKARGIGTVASHAVVTGGLILQASAQTRLVRSETSHRRAWSHYVGRHGVIEVISKADTAQLALGHRSGAAVGTELDLGAISEHLLGVVQMRPQLNYQACIRSRPTRMRWSATAGDQDELAVKLHVDSDVLRTVEVTMPVGQLSFAEQFCEDLALHDWLITTLGNVIEQADRDAAVGVDPIKIFTPVAERLVHLWMPGAHVNPVMRPLWDTLERRPGFSLQWNTQVARIRDKIALRTLEALEHARQRDANW
ncbi:MAG: hypothetical protein JO266_00395 [Acidobacteria bacterium]|nr:hypothetical protein [Pseudonocardiales bacterium]MBV8890436.1 hypothetical protein [Acidobacteriota bacterium]MBV9031831.1 hypothetical protein [Pseudonocardiales bacterium]